MVPEIISESEDTVFETSLQIQRETIMWKIRDFSKILELAKSNFLAPDGTYLTKLYPEGKANWELYLYPNGRVCDSISNCKEKTSSQASTDQPFFGAVSHPWSGILCSGILGQPRVPSTAQPFPPNIPGINIEDFPIPNPSSNVVGAAPRESPKNVSFYLLQNSLSSGSVSITVFAVTADGKEIPGTKKSVQKKMSGADKESSFDEFLKPDQLPECLGDDDTLNIKCVIDTSTVHNPTQAAKETAQTVDRSEEKQILPEVVRKSRDQESQENSTDLAFKTSLKTRKKTVLWEIRDFLKIREMAQANKLPPEGRYLKRVFFDGKQSSWKLSLFPGELSLIPGSSQDYSGPVTLKLCYQSVSACSVKVSVCAVTPDGQEIPDTQSSAQTSFQCVRHELGKCELCLLQEGQISTCLGDNDTLIIKCSFEICSVVDGFDGKVLFYQS